MANHGWCDAMFVQGFARTMSPGLYAKSVRAFSVVRRTQTVRSCTNVMIRVTSAAQNVCGALPE